ncbi:prepilin-type N-terminal cleavage/methylation domain-containing protein [Patescibacteria group bacterium]|nr:prepilin-type N-terminal cleavage/methylation domain-containing protein [Patescibacteria group bacterium]
MLSNKKGFTPLEFFKSFLGVKQNNQKIQTGFTLIELLVVIAIIGLLATIVLVSLNSARIKARDARRQSDMHQIALAMEMYYDSVSPSSYKDLPNGYATAIPSASSISTYMNPVPLDPGNRTYYWSDGGSPTTSYCAWVLLENSTNYVLSNRNGTKVTSTVPSTLATCNQ